MSISSLASVHPLAVKTPPAPSSASHHQGVPLDEGWFIFWNWKLHIADRQIWFKQFLLNYKFKSLMVKTIKCTNVLVQILRFYIRSFLKYFFENKFWATFQYYPVSADVDVGWLLRLILLTLILPLLTCLQSHLNTHRGIYTVTPLNTFHFFLVKNGFME